MVYIGCPSSVASIGDMQIEDFKLSKEVLYHFAIFTIVNKILIFENRRIGAYLPGPSPFARSRRSHCRNKQLCARLETKGGHISPSVWAMDRADMRLFDDF